jgi:thiamine-phosphate pyrophosphorylase
MRREAVLDVFYPIVPNIRWLERIVPLGVKTVQLRLKDTATDEISRQIVRALEVTRDAGCQLIVNDHWRAAIAKGADFIHLGQEDLAGADLPAIKAAGLKLGLSTHSEAELDVALAARPDYVALGPIYETKLKAMAWAPQGLDRIRQWKARIGALPLVAIGGITPERAGPVTAAGAQSVAVISDFMASPHPEARVRLWLEWAATRRGGGEARGERAP